MPPPSPVWAPNYREKAANPVMFFDSSFKMYVRIEGRIYESRTVLLKVKGAEKVKNGGPS